MQANPLRRTCWLGWILLASPAWAQFQQYVQPGSLRYLQDTAWEQVERGSDEARWKWNRVALEPVFDVREAAYVDNVFTVNDSEGDDEVAVSDYRIAIETGVRSYWATGTKSIIAAFVLPSYVWWKDLEERRELDTSYGIGWFGLYNRLRTEISVRTEEQEQFLNNEFRAPVGIQRDILQAAFELDLRGPWSLFGQASETQWEFPAERATVATVSSLDRDETTLRGGVEYRLASGLAIGIGVENSEAEFVRDTVGRSNEGTSPFLRATFDGERANLLVDLVLRSLEFRDDAALDDFEETTGTAQAVWELGHRTRLAAYGSRNLVYSGLNTATTFESEVYGTGLTWGRQEGFTLATFAELGTDRYRTPDAIERRDDVSTLGLAVQWRFTRRLSLQGTLVETDFDSNLEEFDRSVTTAGLTVGLASGGFRW